MSPWCDNVVSNILNDNINKFRFPVAQAFVRNGHEVWGQTRNASKAGELQAEESTHLLVSYHGS